MSMTNTATIRDTRNPNSTVVLTEKAASDLPGIARSAAHLLRLPEGLRTIARQERTFRMNTEPGWRPSDLLGRIVDGLLASPDDGASLCSPTARLMLAEAAIDRADVRALERDLA